MTDAELADEIIARLNRLIEDPAIRADVGKLLAERVACSKATDEHPSIQVRAYEDGSATVSFLGLINGLVGTMPGVAGGGWGYVSAVLEEDGSLVRFCRTFERQLTALGQVGAVG